MASSSIPMSEEDIHELYLWVDEIPLSRPKRNIARDFSDGVCVAEVVKHYFPKLVELHNYAGANSTGQKLTNWNTLNARVFRKLHFEVPPEEIRDIIAAVPGAVERFLRALRTKISQIKSIQEQKQFQQPQQQQQIVSSYSGGPQQPSRPASASAYPTTAAGDRKSSPPGETYASAPQAAASSTQGLRQLLEEKDRTILELRESVALLSDKVNRLEDLLRVKDEKILRYKQQIGR